MTTYTTNSDIARKLRDYCTKHSSTPGVSECTKHSSTPGVSELLNQLGTTVVPNTTIILDDTDTASMIILSDFALTQCFHMERQ